MQTIVSRQLDPTLSPAVISVSTIHGGVRNNILPDSVAMEGTIRTHDEGVRADIRKRIEKTAGAIADVIDDIDTAIDTVNNKRATFGATQSRFDAVISNLQQSVENQSAARSRIMDADFASETANMSRAQILQQAGNAMIAQANQAPQQVLSLLR